MSEPVDAEHAYEELAAISPLFQRVWAKEIEEWADDELGIPATSLMQHLANAISDEIEELHADELQAVFAKLDDLLVRGNQQVGEMVATGFLEALLSEAAYGDLDFSRVRPYIGPEAAEYCEAWDPKTFNGLRP